MDQGTFCQILQISLFRPRVFKLKNISKPEAADQSGYLVYTISPMFFADFTNLLTHRVFSIVLKKYQETFDASKTIRKTKVALTQLPFFAEVLIYATKTASCSLSVFLFSLRS